MAANELFSLLASDELFFDHDEVASGFRDHRGSTSAGRFEDDPEMLEYEDVTYWNEMKAIFDWTETNVHSTLNICWGAMAAIYHFHGVPKHILQEKAFGVYQHRNLNPSSPYLLGFSDDFAVPVSRWTEVLQKDIPADSGLESLMTSPEAGLCLVAEKKALP